MLTAFARVSAFDILVCLGLFPFPNKIHDISRYSKYIH